jgi:hypothetical protein
MSQHKTVDEQLAASLDAIDKIESGGQRYTIKDREVWRGDLEVLDKRALRLERKASRQRNGGLTIQRVIPL